jgi:hypothetical protein
MATAIVHHELLAYLSDDFDEDDVVAVRDLETDLRDAHTWTFEPPYFVDDTDDTSGTRPEDEPIRTVGLMLPLSLNGKDQNVPVTDLNVLIKGLARLSFSRHIEFEIQLDDDMIGTIEDGLPDEAIQEGLLATWASDGDRVPGAAAYQLVMQWPASSVEDYDELVEIEEFLIENLEHGDVDGHDAGQGEMNIFVLTDDPEKTFASVKKLLEKRRAWIDVRIAYRATTRDTYSVLWPKSLTTFKVS